MLLAGLVSQKKERAVVGDPGTKLQHNSMYAGVAKIFSVHDLPAPHLRSSPIIAIIYHHNIHCFELLVLCRLLLLLLLLLLGAPSAIGPNDD